MYRRKVQVVGGSTYIVSIPKQWADEMGIKEGNEVTVEKLADGSLRISPLVGKRTEPPVAKLFISCIESDDVIARAILAYYLTGSREIKLSFKDIECKERVLSVLNFLKGKVLGLEVIEETSDEVILGVILDNRFYDLKSAQQKMIKTISSMVEDTVKAIQSKDIGIMGDIYKRDDLLDRLYLYSLRYITASASTLEARESVPPNMLPHYALITKSLERVGDHISLIARNLMESLKSSEVDESQLSMLQSYLKQEKELLDIIEELLESFSYSKLVLATEKAFFLIKKEGELRKSIDRPTIYYSYVVESCRRIVAYSIDVLESLLDIAALSGGEIGIANFDKK